MVTVRRTFSVVFPLYDCGDCDPNSMVPPSSICDVNIEYIWHIIGANIIPVWCVGDGAISVVEGTSDLC